MLCATFQLGRRFNALFHKLGLLKHQGLMRCLLCFISIIGAGEKGPICHSLAFFQQGLSAMADEPHFLCAFAESGASF